MGPRPRGCTYIYVYAYSCASIPSLAVRLYALIGAMTITEKCTIIVNPPPGPNPNPDRLDSHLIRSGQGPSPISNRLKPSLLPQVTEHLLHGPTFRVDLHDVPTSARITRIGARLRHRLRLGLRLRHGFRVWFGLRLRLGLRFRLRLGSSGVIGERTRMIGCRGKGCTSFGLNMRWGPRGRYHCISRGALRPTRMTTRSKPSGYAIACARPHQPVCYVGRTSQAAPAKSSAKASMITEERHVGAPGLSLGL